MNPIYEHIIKYPGHCSLSFVKNNKPIIQLNEDQKRPLASIYKLVILLAYLDQCTKGKLNATDQVHFKQLKRYWIPWIDPAFMKWYTAVNELGKIKKNSIALSEIVKGMLQYSCNTHTDYLLSILGIDTVQEQLSIYAIKDHDPIMPISTSVLVTLRDGLKIQHTPSSLARIANKSFQLLMEGKEIEGIDLNLLNDFDYKMQCLWSDLLPHGTTRAYAKLLEDIQQLHKHNPALQEVMNWLETMESYKGLIGGMKLGYTPKVFNVALYCTDSYGEEYQLVYFLDNLSESQRYTYEYVANDFNQKLIKDRIFVEGFKNEIQHVLTC